MSTYSVNGSGTSSPRPSSAAVPAPSSERFTPLPVDIDPGGDGISPRHESGYIKGVVQDGNTTLLVVDRVTWVWCSEVDSKPGAVCEDDHRIDNKNTKLRSYRLATDATVIVGDGTTAATTRIDAAQLRSHLEDPQGSSSVYVLRHADNGDVTGISQTYEP